MFECALLEVARSFDLTNTHVFTQYANPVGLGVVSPSGMDANNNRKTLPTSHTVSIHHKHLDNPGGTQACVTVSPFEWHYLSELICRLIGCAGT